MEALNSKKDERSIYTKLKEQAETKVPIYRGCPNERCFCTGKCKEIIGYRDRLPDEQYPNKF